jgi:hypothetical protein
MTDDERRIVSDLVGGYESLMTWCDTIGGTLAEVVGQLEGAWADRVLELVREHRRRLSAQRQQVQEWRHRLVLASEPGRARALRMDDAEREAFFQLLANYENMARAVETLMGYLRARGGEHREARAQHLADMEQLVPVWRNYAARIREQFGLERRQPDRPLSGPTPRRRRTDLAPSPASGRRSHSPRSRS